MKVFKPSSRAIFPTLRLPTLPPHFTTRDRSLEVELRGQRGIALLWTALYPSKIRKLKL